MRNALIIGGSNGIGASIANELLDKNFNNIYIFDREKPIIENEKIRYININLVNNDLSEIKKLEKISCLVYTAGFGRLDYFDSFTEAEIDNSFIVNALFYIKVIKYFYSEIKSMSNFYCAVISSVAGMLSSPLYSVYSSTKAALIRFTESLNIELEESGYSNRILNVAPGYLEGTKFHNIENDLSKTRDLSAEIVCHMFNKEVLFIPDYEKTYKKVLENYTDNPIDFGRQSLKYKLENNKLNSKPQLKIGYLSGTFDLFHIGHLNVLKNAKSVCDYLVVGVHSDASHKSKNVFIPLEERIEILKSIKYVNDVIIAPREDLDAYNTLKYDYLFVGSDYKGTERFKKYEEYFLKTNVKIIYFPYTTGTSSTQLRELIDNYNK